MNQWNDKPFTYELGNFGNFPNDQGNIVQSNHRILFNGKEAWKGAGVGMGLVPGVVRMLNDAYRIGVNQGVEIGKSPEQAAAFIPAPLKMLDRRICWQEGDDSPRLETFETNPT